MKEQVLITQLRITKAGQVKHFQVKLPKNVIRIIGIEMSFRLIHGLSIDETGTGLAPVLELPRFFSPFKSNRFIGELKLQSCEEANIFYATHLQTDENIGAGDFSQNDYWKARTFTHQSKTEEDIVIVDADTTIIQGIYKDRIGEINNTDVEYKVNVYVWVEIEEEGDKS